MESLKNYYHALICYDGTRYFGWQETASGPSIQSAITTAIVSVTQELVRVEAASRTDRGVHAKEQSICFSLEKFWDFSRLQRALNAHLPEDIRVLKISPAQATFHPTLDAKAKQYHYVISAEPFQAPCDRLYAWHVPQALDYGLMKQAAECLCGKHNFSAFSTETVKNPICHIFSLDFLFEGRKITMQMIGDRFIYKMARTIAGTLVYVGRNRLTVAQVRDLLIPLHRADAGMTAPSHGLFLQKVFY